MFCEEIAAETSVAAREKSKGRQSGLYIDLAKIVRITRLAVCFCHRQVGILWCSPTLAVASRAATSP